MLNLNEKFNRLRNEGEFVETVNDVSIRWYFHSLTNGFKVMAKRNADGTGAPTMYNEFHINDKMIRHV